MPPDYAIHSDLLVYWTGAKDIEEECGTAKWYDDNQKRLSGEQKGELAKAYIERLRDILDYGLWMTNQSPPHIGPEHRLEEAACTCFTELKLSQSHTHATRYGRLGVAFKRSFVFDRGGRPVIYYGNRSWTQRDTFLQSCAKDLKDKRLVHFFKPMNSVETKFDFRTYAANETTVPKQGKPL